MRHYPNARSQLGYRLLQEPLWAVAALCIHRRAREIRNAVPPQHEDSREWRTGRPLRGGCGEKRYQSRQLARLEVAVPELRVSGQCCLADAGAPVGRTDPIRLARLP